MAGAETYRARNDLPREGDAIVSWDRALTVLTMAQPSRNPEPAGVYAFEVSCLIRAETQQAALEQLSLLLSTTDRFWIEEGEPVPEDEIARELPPL